MRHPYYGIMKHASIIEFNNFMRKHVFVIILNQVPRDFYDQFNYEVENIHMEIASKDPMKDKKMN